MNYLPETGGCERIFIEPFIEHLNSSLDKNYEHKECSDRESRNTPQPEAVYIEKNTRESIAIERKSVIWPKNYVAKAKIHEEIARSIGSKIKDYLHSAPSSVSLEITISKSNKNSSNDISEKISQELLKSLKSKSQSAYLTRTNEHYWAYTIEHATKTQIEISFTDYEEDITHHHPSDEFLKSLSTQISGASKKFKSKPDSRGILLLEPFGQVLHADKGWWQDAMKSIEIPNEIKEIWIQLPKFISEHKFIYIFEKIHSTYD